MQTRSQTSLLTMCPSLQEGCSRETDRRGRGIRGAWCGCSVRWRGLILVLGWLVGASLQVSCAAHRRTAPGRAVITEYLQAIEANRPERVYAMMGDSYRKKVSLQLFKKLWVIYRPEMQAEARRMRRLLEHPNPSKKNGPGPSSVIVGASGTLPGKGRVVLSWHDGRWVVASGPGTELAGSGIKGALLLLVKMVEARDLNGFLSMLTSKGRAAFWRGVSLRLTKLKTWMSNARIRAQGDRVRFYYSGTYYVDLVRENGHWRIEDFN